VVAHVTRTDDYALASQLLCEIDLVSRRALDEVDIRQLVANFDEGWGRGVKEASASGGARQGQGAGGSKHGECWASGYRDVCAYSVQ
jgi:hypothetical protein